MKRQKCASCTPEAQCDEHFIERVDAQLDLNTTIRTIHASLSEENKKKFAALSLREKQWIAIQAHADGLIEYGKVTRRS